MSYAKLRSASTPASAPTPTPAPAPAPKPNSPSESNGGLEITPKSEKKQLAAAYSIAAILGVVFYDFKDQPKVKETVVWQGSTNGAKFVDRQINYDYWLFAVLFYISLAVLLAIKIRIWWRHY